MISNLLLVLTGSVGSICLFRPSGRVSKHYVITWFVPSSAADWFFDIFCFLPIGCSNSALNADWSIFLKRYLQKFLDLLENFKKFISVFSSFKLRIWTEPSAIMVLLTEENFPVTFGFLRRIGLELWDDGGRRILPDFSDLFENHFEKSQEMHDYVVSFVF